MLNSIPPSRNPDYGKCEEHDVAADPMMRFPTNRMQMHKNYFVQPTTHTISLNRQQDADQIPRNSDHIKLEEDGDENVDANDMMKDPAKWLLKLDHLCPNTRAVIHKMKDDERELPTLRKWASYAYYDGKPKKGIGFSNPNPFYFSPEYLAEMFPCGLPNGGKCYVCLKESHVNHGGCPYRNSCPIGAQIGDSYYIACKHCGDPLDGKPLDKTSSYCCTLQEAHARVKTCCKCGVDGDHRVDDCPMDPKDFINPFI